MCVCVFVCVCVRPCVGVCARVCIIYLLSNYNDTVRMGMFLHQARNKFSNTPVIIPYNAVLPH